MKIYRKKHRPLPVSFFAFQDIITALAGCMLIFVLTLALEKSRSGSTEAPKGYAEQKNLDFLQEKIRLTEFALVNEEKKTALLRQQFDREQLNEQNKKLNQRLENSGRMLKKTAEQRSQMLENMQKELTELKKQTEKLKAANPELADLINQSTKLEKEYRSRQKKLAFNNNSKRKNIVLTISRNCWQLQTTPMQKAEIIGSGTDALPLLKKKIRLLAPAQLRMIIAVRPSAGGFAEALKKELKKSFPAMEIVAEPLSDETLGGVIL